MGSQTVNLLAPVTLAVAVVSALSQSAARAELVSGGKARTRIVIAEAPRGRSRATSISTC
jgi:hypothetical protein